MVIGVVLQIFQRQVFQLALQLIQSQFVSQGRIEIGGLLRHLVLGTIVVCIFYLSHQVHAVRNHNQNDAHVLGK